MNEENTLLSNIEGGIWDKNKVDEIIESIISKIGYGKYQNRLLFLCAGGYYALCTEILLIVFLEESCTKAFHISLHTFSLISTATTTLSLVYIYIYIFSWVALYLEYWGTNMGAKYPLLLA